MPDEPLPPSESDTIDRLNELNRIQLEARMLPRGKQLSKEQVDGVREAFARYIGERDVKPSQVAREIDYGPSVVSQWADSKYKGNVDKVTHAINDWMERDRRRADASKPRGYVKTWVADTMRTIAYQADKHGLMAAIVAPAGCGKTMVLKVLADEMRAVYIYCDERISERELLYKIAVALGSKAETASKARLRQYIVDCLAGTKRIIFLDEAQNLSRAIRAVRSIFDQAEVPIVMAGTAEILDYVDDRADGRGQFASRCIRYSVLQQIRNAEGPDGDKAGKAGRPLFTQEEIQRFFTSKKIRLSTDAMLLMWRLACLPSHGTLRLVEKLAAIATDLNRSASALSRDDVMEALDMFRGTSEANYLESLAERLANAA